ncbi:MAG: CHASE3 domain-containing protein [Acidobacteria bacterium]|nr:CHASE3 domain-containing protein [Acidobacteriota bacterium]
MWFSTARASRRAEAQVQHTLDVQNELERLLSTLQDVETGYRGFVITGNETFLEPGRAGASDARTRYDRLNELTRDSEVQQQRLRELKGLIDRKLAFNDRVLLARRAEGFGAARRLIATGEGKRVMDVIRAVIAQMRTEEVGQLAIERAAAAQRGRNIGYLAAAAAVLLATTVGAFLVIARRDIARRRSSTEALRRSEATLRASAEQLERSNRDLQDFAMIASHDLQEPLRKILMFGERLRDEAGPSLSVEALDYLRRMQTAAERGQTLIQGLLAYSRVATKAQPPEPVDLDRVAREVVDDLEARLAQAGGEVRIGDLPTIEADPLQMRQLLQNLIANALKFHRPGEPPRIEVHARPATAAAGAPDGWEISVADNGIGFDEKYLDRIFKLFQRLHERNTYDGAGMGLAICRRIVERHGGTITARSTPGNGSTFLIAMPSRQPVTETAA